MVNSHNTVTNQSIKSLKEKYTEMEETIKLFKSDKKSHLISKNDDLKSQNQKFKEIEAKISIIQSSNNKNISLIPQQIEEIQKEIKTEKNEIKKQNEQTHTQLIHLENKIS